MLEESIFCMLCTEWWVVTVSKIQSQLQAPDLVLYNYSSYYMEIIPSIRFQPRIKKGIMQNLEMKLAK